MAGRNKDYLNGAPTIPQFCDKNGCSLRPFLHTVERVRSIETNFRWVEQVNEDERRYVYFFVEGADLTERFLWDYRRTIGDLLAEGVKIAAEKIGKGSERFAIHVKGLELPAWGPRGVPAMGPRIMPSSPISSRRRRTRSMPSGVSVRKTRRLRRPASLGSKE